MSTEITWGFNALTSNGSTPSGNHNPSVKLNAGVASTGTAAKNFKSSTATQIPPLVTEARKRLDKLEEFAKSKGFAVSETRPNATGKDCVIAALTALLRYFNSNPADKANVEALAYRVIEAAKSAGWITDTRFTWNSFIQSSNIKP